MKTALIIAADGVQDVELVYPYYRLQEAGYTVKIIATGRQITGINGMTFVTYTTFQDNEIWSDWDNVLSGAELLILPGGIKAIEKLRLFPVVSSIIKTHRAAGKVIGAMCSGTLLLISAGLAKGRKMSCYYSWRCDLENAGATFVDGVVTDDRIVTAPHYRELGPWMAAVLAEVERVSNA